MSEDVTVPYAHVVRAEIAEMAQAAMRFNDTLLIDMEVLRCAPECCPRSRELLELGRASCVLASSKIKEFCYQNSLCNNHDESTEMNADRDALAAVRLIRAAAMLVHRRAPDVSDDLIAMLPRTVEAVKHPIQFLTHPTTPKGQR